MKLAKLVKACRGTAVVALASAISFSVSARTALTEKDFESDLGVVERTIGAGKWKDAKALLLATLEKHKDQRWVLYHLTEIKDDLERCAFWSGNAKPNPKDLVSGKLVSYSASSGQIDLRYEGSAESASTGKGTSTEEPKPDGKKAAGARATLHASYKDFSDGGGFHMHPLAFDGPFKIVLNGQTYPSQSESEHPPQVVVCANLDEAFLVSFGFLGEHVGKEIRWVPARIVHLKDGEAEVVDVANLPDLGKLPYTLEVVVSASTITVNFGGTKLLTCAKPSALFGRFGFQNCPRLTELAITGKVQPSWIQGVIDSAIQEKWAPFVAKYEFRDELPEWLKSKVKKASRQETSFFDSYPDDPGAEHAKAKEQLALIEAFFKKNDVKGAADYVHSIPESDATPAQREWLNTALDLARNAPADALASCRKVAALDPRFFPARQLAIHLVLDLGSRREAIDECRALTKEFESDGRSYSDLARLLLLDDRFDDARSTVRSAIDAGVAQDSLEEVDRLLQRTVKGPPWTRSFEYKSDHYDVVSDISQDLCFRAASLLEKFYAKFNVHLRFVPSGPKRLFRVYLFSGRAGYQAYTKDMLGEETKHTAGLYSPLVKQLLIWNLPDVEDMLRTVRHEGFHQYLDRLVSDAPRWLNEGMAEYFEVSKIVNGNWSDGELQPVHVATLHKSPLVPLKQLMQLDARSFYDEKTVELHYAESWAFVHFLLNSGAEHKKRFDKLLDALFAGTKANEAIAKAFDDASLPALQRDFASYVSGLK